MGSLFRRFLVAGSLSSMLLMSGCASSLQSWIVSTRNHQGDLALESRRYKEAVLAYRLALQLDEKDSHAQTNYVEAECDLAEQLYGQSEYVDALAELQSASKIDPQSVRVAGLRSDVENARLKQQIVLSNFPTYEASAEAISEAFKNLRVTDNEVIYRLQRFGHTYDTADLTNAIRGSMELTTDASKLTVRLANLRNAVSVGSSSTNDATPSTISSSAGSILPLP
jgi:tetratricopeptide (TPR) repeat protein